MVATRSITHAAARSIAALIRGWRGALLILTCVCACAGNGPPPTEAGSSFEVIQRTIFDVNCLSAGCHNSTDQAANLVLVEGQSYGNLVGVTPSTAAAAAAGLRRVVKNNLAQSLLWLKLTAGSSLDPRFGSPMPRNGSPLSAADIDQIRAWILAGAPAPNIATATPSPSPSFTTTATSTASPTITRTPTITPTGTRPPTATPTSTPSTTPTPSASATASAVPTPTFSVDSTFPQIQASIFSTTCIDAGCHSGQFPAGGQDLELGHAYASLVGVVPQNAAAAAAGMLRVDPGKPANSFLITKLTLPQPFDDNFGSRMPFTKPPLSPDQIERIRAWILRGALADEAGG